MYLTRCPEAEEGSNYEKTIEAENLVGIQSTHTCQRNNIQPAGELVEEPGMT